VTAYGASGHEAAVREKVKELLPEWARKRTQTDDAGNLILHLGDEKPSGKTPRLAFVAHMDEIGYEVKKIADDGRVELAVVGGGYPQYFLGHTALLHKSDGSITGAAMELPSGWDKPGFEWPQSLRTMDDPARAYVGTTSREETEKLGIKAGDWVTIEKAYRPLIGTRAVGRSFDDRTLSHHSVYRQRCHHPRICSFTNWGPRKRRRGCSRRPFTRSRRRPQRRLRLPRMDGCLFARADDRGLDHSPARIARRNVGAARQLGETHSQ